jgi:integrase/recombinase XerD
MNPKDMAHLKYKNIEGEFIHFVRAKTERTTRNDPKLITVYFNEDMHKIVERWGNKDKSPNNFIFPILKLNDNLMRQFNLVKSLIKFVNDGMSSIAQQLNINKKVTNIVSRHTFSTVLKRAGASTEFIQESLGHADKKTTENYLDSFEKEIKKEFASRLTAFK